MTLMQRTRLRNCHSTATRELEIRLLLVAALVMTVGCRPKQGGSQGQPTENSPGSWKVNVTVRPLTDRKFQRTPERLTRGKYLVNGIGECFACHGPSDPNLPGWPPLRGKEGSGYADYTPSGEPRQVAPNITSDRITGAGNWTDDMLARAVREGVGHDGHLLDPTVMPYESYRAMSDEDLASIIVYLRSIPAIFW